MKNAFVSWFVTDVLLAPFHELICLSKLGRPMGMYKSYSYLSFNLLLLDAVHFRASITMPSGMYVVGDYGNIIV